MHSSVRSGSAWLLALFLVAPLAAQPAESAPPAPAGKSGSSEAELKLAVALRSYTLLDAEVDRLKEANARLTTEKSALESRLSEAQNALPLAAQTVALREQLRQTQAQMAAYAEENAQLKTRLSFNASAPGGQVAASVAPVAAPATPAAPPRPGPRTHVIAPGDTLLKISQNYYGTPSRWNDILGANRETLRDEKNLTIGRTLVIP